MFCCAYQRYRKQRSEVLSSQIEKENIVALVEKTPHEQSHQWQSGLHY